MLDVVSNLHTLRLYGGNFSDKLKDLVETWPRYPPIEEDC